MVVALKPLHDVARIKRVVVATYQSTSGAGKEAMDELFNQTRAIFVNRPFEAKKFTKQIAFNVIPHIDVFMEDGSTKEEWKMVVETKKILDPEHQGACHLRARAGVHRPCRGGQRRVRATARARTTRGACWRPRPGVLVVDHRGRRRLHHAAEVTGEDAVFVSRIREDPTVENGLSLWVVCDNLRKGAALNAIQIAEELIRSYI